MTTLNVINAELTPEQCAELDAAAGNPDLIETILNRITDEIISRNEIAEEPVSKSIEAMANRIRYKLFSDVLLNLHHLIHHDRDMERVKHILCPVAAMIEGEMPPSDVVKGMLRLLDEVNLEREKFECGGHA